MVLWGLLFGRPDSLSGGKSPRRTTTTASRLNSRVLIGLGVLAFLAVFFIFSNGQDKQRMMLGSAQHHGSARESYEALQSRNLDVASLSVGNLLSSAPSRNETDIFQGIALLRKVNLTELKTHVRYSYKSLLEERRKWTSEQWAEHAFKLVELNRIKGDPQYSKVDSLIFTYANYGIREYVMNWIASLLMTYHDRFSIFCVDEKLYSLLLEYGFDNHATMVPEKWRFDPLLSTLTENMIKKQPPKASNNERLDVLQDYGTVTYNQFTFLRYFVAFRLWERVDIALLFSDVDIVFLSPSILGYIEFTHTRFGQELLFQTNVADRINAGFIWARGSDASRSILQDGLTRAAKNGVMDQTGIQEALKNLSPEKQKLVGRLDALLFASGHTLELSKANYHLNIVPLMVHINWNFKQEFKKTQLQRYGLWFVGDEFV